MTTKKRERHVSPRGVAVWPRLNEPDTKFKPEGEYSVSLAFDPADKDFQKFARLLEQRRDEAFKEFLSENPKKKKVAEVAPVYTDELDEDGNETGRVLVKFKMKASGTSKRTGKTFTMRPDLFDAKGKKLEGKLPQVGGGSVLKVSFEPGTSFVESAKKFYLTCYMVAVQIIELVEYGTRNAQDYGFGEEDGYEADDAPFPTADEDEGDSPDEDDDDGDY